MARRNSNDDLKNLLKLSSKDDNELCSVLNDFLICSCDFLYNYIHKNHLTKAAVAKKTFLSRQTVYNRFDYSKSIIPELETIRELIRAFDFDYIEANQFIMCLIRDAVFSDQEFCNELKNKKK